MTGPYTFGSRPPTPSSTHRAEQGHTAAQSAGRKLRDSCEACASSKLKCPRQKPTCSRCAKRGVPCTYLATRRGGRKSISAGRPTNPRIESDPSPPSTVASTIICESPVDEFASMGDWFPPRPEDFMGQVSGPSTCDMLSPMTSAVMGTHFEDYLASTENLSRSFSLPDQAQSFFAELDGGKDDLTVFLGPLPLFENTVAQTVTHTDIRMTASTSSSSSSTVEPPSPQSGTSCLHRGIELLKELSPNACSVCSSSNGAGNAKAARTTRDIISTNKKTIDAVASILDCSCSQDGFLLSVLLIIVLRTLDWYTAAARMATGGAVGGSSNFTAGRSTSPPPQAFSAFSTTASSGIEKGEDLRQIAAQRILSELHYVQRLAKQLSEKMDRQTERCGGADVTMAGVVSGQTPLTGETALSEDLSPFSPSTWNKLNVELKQKLQALSRGIISVLRGK